MPTLALNTAGLTVEGTERAVRLALASGITHVDFHPGTERDGVARALRSAGRQNMFLTTKIRKAPPGTSPAAAAERLRAQIDEDLRALGVGNVDMIMLRDSPDCAVIQAQWAALEEALAAGKCRAVGVVNFCESALRCVLATAKVPPALNYFMLHVGMGPDPQGLRSFGEARGVRTFAYGALGEPAPSGELLAGEALREAAAAHGRAPEAAALRWALQSGAAVSVRPTAEFSLEGGSACADGPHCAEGVRARADSFAWALSDAEMAALDALRSPGGNPTLFSSDGCPGAFKFPK